MVEPFTSMNRWLSDLYKGNVESILSLLEDLGLEDTIHLIYTPDKIHVEEVGSAFEEKLGKLFDKQHNITQLTALLDEKNRHFTIIINKKSYIGYNLKIIANLDNNAVILIHNSEKRYTVAKIEDIIRFGSLAQQIAKKIASLEKSIKMIHAEPQMLISQTNLQVTEVPKNFITDSVPAVFCSVLNEDIGPIIFTSFPEYLTSAEYQILGVNVFSGVDSELLKDLGHIFSSTQIKTPVLGELFNVLFTVSNSHARGEFGIHAISVLIDYEFVNLAKSIQYQIKAYLFSGIEKIRQFLNERGIDLVTNTPNMVKEQANEFQEVLLSLQHDISLLFAELLSKEDVLNW